MTVTLNLSPKVEQALLGEAALRGLTPDEFVSEVLLARAAQERDGVAMGAHLSCPRLQMEGAIPVLHTGKPMALDVINDTLELLRHERDLSSLGTF